MCGGVLSGEPVFRGFPCAVFVHLALPAGVTVWQQWEGSLQFIQLTLKRCFWNTSLGKLFHISLLKRTLEKQYCCIAYLIFRLMNLNSQKTNELILHIYKILPSVGKKYL